MLLIAIVFFLLAAMLGIYLLSYVFAEKNTPKGVVIIHGFLAFLGILFLILYSFFYTIPLFSLIFFIVAALGGGFMLKLDIFGKKIPKILALGHGVIALVGLLLLIAFFMNYFK